MKKAVLSLAALTILFSACKKKGDDIVLNQWTANGTTYHASTVTRSTLINTLTPTDNTTSGSRYDLSFYFTQIPERSGNYKVVDFPTAADEVAMAELDGSFSGIYRSTAAEGKTIIANVSNGKVTIYFNSDITLQPVFPFSGTPLVVNGAIREN